MAQYLEEMDVTVKELYFNHLDEIREGGTMNMFAAPQYLHERFELDIALARALFSEWCERHSK